KSIDVSAVPARRSPRLGATRCVIRPQPFRPLRGSDMCAQQKIIPSTIETLADAVYPSFAMLAGMDLDIFTPFKDGPLTAAEIARAAGTDQAKTAPLLHALVATGLLKSEGARFANSPEADRFLVRGRPDYIGIRHHAYRRRWNSVLSVAQTIRAGVP